MDYIKGSERRFYNEPVELREEDGKKYIVGTPIVVERVADIGPYEEVIDKEATRGVIENNDIRVLRDHNTSELLGRSNKGKGTAKITRDKDGNLSYSIEVREDRPILLSTYDEVRSGDLDGGSFAFLVERDEITYPTEENKRTKPLRRIKEFRAVMDMGPVVYPAYQDTTASVRSIDQQKQKNNLKYRKTLFNRKFKRDV